MVHAVMVTLLPWQHAKYCHGSTIITHTYICTYGNKMCRGLSFTFVLVLILMFYYTYMWICCDINILRYDFIFGNTAEPYAHTYIHTCAMYIQNFVHEGEQCEAWATLCVYGKLISTFTL